LTGVAARGIAAWFSRGGKIADFIVLDRNFFKIPAEQIADIKVLQTVVGGRSVYEASGLSKR
jgi:hypothetical protein